MNATFVCSKCGATKCSQRELREYNYKESGLEDVLLIGGVTETKCGACGETFIRVWKEPQLLQLIARDLLINPASRTGPELRFIRRACGLTQDALAAALNCRRATISEREAKENPGLNVAEEIGIRIILLKAFLRFLGVPGNNALQLSQAEALWKFTGQFEKFANRVHATHKFKLTQLELWTSESERVA